MADYTILGSASPVGVSASGDATQLSVSTAFYVLGVTGWRVKGVRVWIPAGTPAISGLKAYLWTGAGNSPTSSLATADFGTITPDAWNTVNFSSPVSMLTGKYYWAQVYFPAGQYGFKSHFFPSDSPLTSVEIGNLYAAGSGEVSTSNGSFVVGAAGLAPATGNLNSWYGVDVVVDDGTGASGPGSTDNVGINDTVTSVRSGLPSAIHATGTATDTLNTKVTATAEFPIGGATAFHTIRRSHFELRISWGSIMDDTINGPTFIADGTPLTMGLEFHVQWPVRFVGCRIYKNPDAFGTIPVRLWDLQGVGGAARELGNTTVTWVADEGGWREIIFPTPIELAPDVNYTVSYYSPSGHMSMSIWVFNVWNDVMPPTVVNAFNSNSKTGASVYRDGTAQLMPISHVPHNYYLDPIVEWDSDWPVFKPDPERTYWDQWVNGKSTHKFMVGVYYADPEFLSEYWDMGVDTLVAGPAIPDYVNAVLACGIDHYPLINPSDDPYHVGFRNIMEIPAYGARVHGYVISDEPDMFFPFTPPEAMQLWCNGNRQFDSTRPLKIGMGNTIGKNQTFYHQPQGASMDVANELWRGWAQLPDVLSGDFYTLSPYEDPSGRWGVWMYPVFVRRLRSLNEGTTPVVLVVETTSRNEGFPIPENVRKAIWSALIEGISGLILFDHRFGSALVEQDFAHMLHNPPMKSMMTTLIVRIKSLADAINSPDLGLVTAWTSSNKTSGPMGGTYGVPMHFTTRQDADYYYLWAMGIRPGSTTATFTIPSWAGETLEVIDESRTIAVDGSGVLTDDFPADYTTHLYRLAK